MIARTWSGTARRDKIDAYVSYLRDKTLPGLRAIAGYRGAHVLRRPAGDEVAVTVITFWDSVEAIAHFAGEDPERAVVSAEARALLSGWDPHAAHWDIVHSTEW
jgi:heme-degrading monooxygenase HmoA